MIQFALGMTGSYQGTPFRNADRAVGSARRATLKAAQGMIRNTTSSWGSVARWLHWMVGAAIIAMLAYGWWMNHIPARADRFFYRSIHADIGYLVLLLMLLRLIWRSLNPTPALSADTPRWQRVAARLSHGALYAVTIVVAMLGWALSGASKPGYADWFGLFGVPQFTSTDKAAADAYEGRHIFMAYVLLALIVIHIAAAAWHHFGKRDRVTSRMFDGKPG
jgi:cytochrome b561